MNAVQITLVRSTWSKIRPISETAAKLFYDRLFELDPSVKPLFKSSVDEQGRKLMQLIDVAVDRLSRPETLVSELRDLGRRHVAYGVEDRHYDIVGAALLWTLEQGLGEDFTPEARQAWTEAYVLLAGTMRGPAAEAA